MYVRRIFYLRTLKYLKKYPLHGKNFSNRIFLFSRGKGESAKIYSKFLGGWGRGHSEISNRNICFFCRFGFSIKEYVSIYSKICFEFKLTPNCRIPFKSTPFREHV